MKRFLFAAVVISSLVLMTAGQNIYAGSQSVPSLSGKVVETMNSGGYTYVNLENNGKKTWVAVPEMKVSKGQKISFQPGIEMINFESKTLKRKFDKIYFSTGTVK